MSGPRHVGVLVTLAALLASPAPAFAYRTAGDTPELSGTSRVRWPDGAVTLELSDRGDAGLSLPNLERELRSSLRTWSDVSCAQLDLRYGGVTLRAAEPGDSRNTVQFINSRWMERGLDPAAAATTDVLYERSASGEWTIVEGDILINAEHHDWVVAGDGGPDARDVLSVATHEVGHLLGAEHPCSLDGRDDAPACDADPGFAVTTMYPLYSPGQRELSADDRAAACFLYPPEPCELTGCTGGLSCTSEGCVARCGEGVCARGEWCSATTATCVASCEDESCARPGSCDADSDCPERLSCQAGACAAGPRPLGDPCERHGDCSSAVCSGGVCARQCAGPDDCASGQSCDSEVGEEPVCSSGLGRFDEPCAAADDCDSRLCLSVDGASSCTRECGLASPECPDGWRCDEAGGRLVCRPRSSATCSFGHSRLKSSPLLLALLALLLRLPRTRRRNHANEN